MKEDPIKTTYSPVKDKPAETTYSKSGFCSKILTNPRSRKRHIDTAYPKLDQKAAIRRSKDLKNDITSTDIELGQVILEYFVTILLLN